MAAVKAKQNIELEVADLQQQLDDTLKNKSDLEDRMLRINREKTDLSRYYYLSASRLFTLLTLIYVCKISTKYETEFFFQPS